MAKFLVLGNGKITLVDDDVHIWASCYRWQEVNGYAARHAMANHKGCWVYLHREIANTPEGMNTDHVDHDPLNNLKSNLRSVTISQNGQNRAGAARHCRTSIRGVVKTAEGNYQARVGMNRKRICIGTFPTLAEADAAAKEGRRRLMTHSPECWATQASE